MDCLIRTVSIKLPSLLTITTDGNLQIVSVYLNSDNVDISADTPVSSGIANKPVSSLSLPQVIDTSINSPSTNPISVEQKTERPTEMSLVSILQNGVTDVWHLMESSIALHQLLVGFFLSTH